MMAAKDTKRKTRTIDLRGVKVHNLKNLDVSIPLGKLTVITGLSGSGKSSLAFDTLYAEGQRRYVESLSAYARQFLGRMQKPDVDMIADIPPGHRHRTEGEHLQSPFDGGHCHGDLRLSQAVVRKNRTNVLSRIG